MARYTGSVCRLCRREGAKLFLKGERCYTGKCAIEKRNHPPGMHGTSHRTKISEYGVQLREKQKVRRIYGVLERQFRRMFKEAVRRKGMTGENLLLLLECRLDNVVHRLGFATSRSQARQFVAHGHVLLNGKKADIPSMSIKAGDEISIREKSRRVQPVVESTKTAVGRSTFSWLEVDLEKMVGKMISVPKREELTLPIDEQLIVEKYSR